MGAGATAGVTAGLGAISADDLEATLKNVPRQVRNQLEEALCGVPPKVLDSAEADLSDMMVQVRTVFDTLDKDNSGEVSKAEFMEIAPKLSPKLFAGFDFHKYAGSTGSMSWLEFCGGMKSAGCTAKEAMDDIFKATVTVKDKEILAPKMKQAKEEFDKVAGVDGYVDIMEYFAKADTVPLFKDVGFAVAAGADGKLSFEEFVKALQENGNLPKDLVL